ncbi:MAG: hypothetical protein HQ508_01725 [Candidatus Marinimicrobia bacterium]|nr:hypothetical protein [Candidatus Neomarinimicrobiota bacterium]
MASIREDYIMRMIQMIGEVILAALKLRKTGHIVEADQTLSDALLTIMPEHADLVDMVDEKTAISLLGNSQLIEVYVELLLERAEIKIALDALNEAEQVQSRALRIFICSLLREPTLSPHGYIIWGRLAGLELRLLLSESEYDDWLNIQKLLEQGAIHSP